MYYIYKPVINNNIQCFVKYRHLHCKFKKRFFLPTEKFDLDGWNFGADLYPVSCIKRTVNKMLHYNNIILVKSYSYNI